MPDVGQLVGDDAFQLVRRQRLHDAFGRRHRGVLRVPPGRERVRRRVRNDVDLRHRQPGLDRQPLRHLVQRMSRPDLLRAIHAQDDLVREPVGAQVHQGREPERQDHALLTAGQIADQQQHAAQRAEQQRGLHSVCHDVILPLLPTTGESRRPALYDRTPRPAQEFPAPAGANSQGYNPKMRRGLTASRISRRRRQPPSPRRHSRFRVPAIQHVLSRRRPHRRRSPPIPRA